MGRSGLLSLVLTCITAWVLGAGAPSAAPALSFNVPSQNEDLRDDLRATSLLASAIAEGETAPSDLVSAALADYRRLVETLYAYGHYSGVVRIQVNGREAASLSLLSLPAEITRVAIIVDPGPPFRFGQTRIAPLAPGDAAPEGFAQGQPALATVIRQASQSAIVGWREAGHAKAEQGPQRIVADHNAKTLSADLTIIPGPRLRFGDLIIKGESAVRPNRIARIADLPSGEVFSPEALDAVTTRMRRTGTFSSVSLREGPAQPDGTMDIELTVIDRAPRRFGFGAELSSLEGLSLSGFWLHRNLLGGAEHLRVEGEINQIAAQDGNGMDFKLGARLEFPSALRSDTTLFVLGELESLDEPTFRSDTFELGVGVTWYPMDGFEAETGVAFFRSKTRSALGPIDYTLIEFPNIATWDKRDDPLNATGGTFLRATATPYLGLSDTASGLRLTADARAYRSFGDGRFVLAGRVQWGSIIGSDLTETHPDMLFLSGGGGTVRGQPYQSLGVDLPPNLTIGGRSFLGTMVELRTGFTETLGGVIFVDAGYVGSGSFLDGTGEWHAGAGFGVRYNTGIGPLRVDIAAPVSGNTGDGVQLYIGIGQAF
ncbi:autotransporter assembly complex protein TamA [Aestuariivita boseongensis]|uniref:autotransporter assembly complex protein TamA n=1 Tax=Aestuariivita boseongensis TaxID=1470562 RepID=UPI00068313EB|nr:BamA/TamA family outer membrane protein [Aestuariivita boseongensis]